MYEAGCVLCCIVLCWFGVERRLCCECTISCFLFLVVVVANWRKKLTRGINEYFTTILYTGGSRAKDQLQIAILFGNEGGTHTVELDKERMLGVECEATFEVGLCRQQLAEVQVSNAPSQMVVGHC